MLKHIKYHNSKVLTPIKKQCNIDIYNGVKNKYQNWGKEMI